MAPHIASHTPAPRAPAPHPTSSFHPEAPRSQAQRAPAPVNPPAKAPAAPVIVGGRPTSTTSAPQAPVGGTAATRPGFAAPTRPGQPTTAGTGPARAGPMTTPGAAAGPTRPAQHTAPGSVPMEPGQATAPGPAATKPGQATTPGSAATNSGQSTKPNANDPKKPDPSKGPFTPADQAAIESYFSKNTSYTQLNRQYQTLHTQYSQTHPRNDYDTAALQKLVPIVTQLHSLAVKIDGMRKNLARQGARAVPAFAKGGAQAYVGSFQKLISTWAIALGQDKTKLEHAEQGGAPGQQSGQHGEGETGQSQPRPGRQPIDWNSAINQGPNVLGQAENDFGQASQPGGVSDRGQGQQYGDQQQQQLQYGQDPNAGQSGADPNAESQIDPNAQYGQDATADGSADPNAQYGQDPNAQDGQDPNAAAMSPTGGYDPSQGGEDPSQGGYGGQEQYGQDASGQEQYGQQGQSVQYGQAQAAY